MDDRYVQVLHTSEQELTREDRRLQTALRRGDRIAAIRLAQRLWSPGDLRRFAVLSLRTVAR